ncbi:hypothetical protein [Ornithinimicrobium cavernae]|uniref:hypothetical protein n=1 Tax=Ornithinimicrobium cavernae TaxID=2666047 RepID=UPI0012B17ED6|nr:hypothetical protein [Ornithinimicrobium cavernae]
MKKLTAVLTSLVLSATMMAGTATSASAAEKGLVRDSCIGTRIHHKPLVNGYGNTIGRVELWYSPRNGGQNCAMTYNYAKGKRFTGTFLVVDRDRNNISYDDGWYEHYAGGAYRNGTDGHCVRYGGFVMGPNRDSSKDDATWNSAFRWCG